MNEASLIQACARGERIAQRAVYERHIDRVYYLALRLTRNEQDAFDVAQEAFLRAFENIRSFDQRSSLGTWLYRIATNEALQLLRHRGMEQRHVAKVGQRSQKVEADDSRRLEVEDALDRLSDEHRAVLILKYCQGLSYEQIAAILEIAAGTVASRLNRARSELRRVLSGDSTPSVEESGVARHPTGVTDATGRVSK